MSKEGSLPITSKTNDANRDKSTYGEHELSDVVISSRLMTTTNFDHIEEGLVNLV